MDGIFDRAELLLGREVMVAFSKVRVIVFGVGGVGSWCVESLVRTGIKHITIVDADTVSVTNVNRQLMATTQTVGEVKVDVLRKRLLEINPDAEVKALHEVYTDESSSAFSLDEYDYVIDCIDSLKDKIALLLNASQTKAKVFSSMGAALKIDPTQIKVAEYWKVRGCPLGAMMRKKMKRAKVKPAQPIQCVYSEELRENKSISDETCSYKAQINGSLAHITAIFGFTLAGLVIKDIVEKSEDEPPLM